MPNSTSTQAAISTPLESLRNVTVNEATNLELAQTLIERLAISDQDWHRLKSNRNIRASEQVAAALVFLLKDQPKEALLRLQQAIGWLDYSISAPPCPSHGPSKNEASKNGTSKKN